MRIELDEVRRLTGPNLLWDKPGAIVDVFIEGIDSAKVVACWQKWMNIVLVEFNWPHEQHTCRLYKGGASLALSAPMDALYTACELAELAWHSCVADLEKTDLPNMPEKLQTLRGELSEEQNPKLMALFETAEQHNVTCLLDDDECSLGMGPSAITWPVNDLPSLDSIDWHDFTDIPCAFITGTNGKSTSVRLAAYIAQAAGLRAGVTSTDFIRVGDHIIDHGDYSGPGGARMLLRNTQTEIAFLEVARGGILRRGLPLSHVNAALVTNVASDHLGQYGINTVDELAEAKFVVSKALDKNAVLVVNADNEFTIKQGLTSQKALCWFSENQENTLIQQQLIDKGMAVFIRDGFVVYSQDGQQEKLIEVKRIPMTFRGTARHNVQNALGVVGLCKALNMSSEAIVQGLLNFSSNAQDNPGRGNLYQVNGAKVIVDFAHNEHSMKAVVNMVKNMPAKRRMVMFSHAGDRSDQDIQDLTSAVMDLEADCYVIAEIEKYLRGREFGDIPTLVKNVLLSNSVDPDSIQIVDTPFEGTEYLLKNVQSSDVVLLFVLDQREQIHNRLNNV